MPYVLPLPAQAKQAGWKAKIHDNERLEPPHVTIYRKYEKWRVCLRTLELLDTGRRASDIDGSVWEAVTKTEAVKLLRHHWDKIHGDNPIGNV